MCELGVFPIFFLKNDFSKVNKILALTFLSQEKDFEGLKTFLFFVLFFFFIYRSWFFFFNAMFTTPVYNSRRRGRFVNSAFLTRNVLPPKNSSNRAAMSTLYRKNDTTNLSGYKLGELTGNEKKKEKKLYFSSRVRKQFKILTAPFEPLRPCSVKW